MKMNTSLRADKTTLKTRAQNINWKQETKTQVIQTLFNNIEL